MVLESAVLYLLLPMLAAAEASAGERVAVTCGRTGKTAAA
jgi:hypothetical protein